MVERKAFLANPKHQYRISQCVEHDCSANNKRIEIIMGMQVCPISQMNFDYKETQERKAFFANPKHQCCVSQCGGHDYKAHNK